MTNTSPPQDMHWRDRAIEVSEVISDSFEVVKAYGARIAEWVLFFCLFANILEMFSLPFPSWFGTVVLAIQAVTLDIAGFGLATMAEHARRRGDEAAARTGQRMGWTLIYLMILTVGLITLSLLIPETRDFVAMCDKILILARVIVTVFYGHIVHSLRHAGREHEHRVRELTNEVSVLKKHLDAKQQELDGIQSRLSSLQQRLDDETEKVRSVQQKLDYAQQQVSSLEQELDTGHGDTASLRRKLNEATQEVERLRGRLNTAKQDAEMWHTQLDVKTRELDTVPSHVSGWHRELDSHSQILMSNRQKDHETGQPKSVHLDTRRGESALAKRIQQVMIDQPGISGRAIANEVACSPTSANKWKKFFDEDGTLELLASPGEAMNE